MTDTPRTRDELLSIFATNGSGDISAQDMRDFVVSSVPAGGRFIAQANIAIPANLTVPDGIANGITLPLGDAPSLKDPGGLLNVSPITYYTQTFAPGEALILQPGSWAYEVQMIWDTNTTGDRIGLLTNSDIRIETPGQMLDTWLGDPEYGSWPELSISQVNASTMTDKGSYRYWTSGGVVTLQPTYTDAVWTTYVAQTSGSDRTLIGYQVSLTQITG